MPPRDDSSEPRDPRDKRDKVPALIAAAERARDDETALLLLQKAKQIDPANIDVYLRRAEIYERRGDAQREHLELKEALEADPTSWVVRYRMLNLEYPKSRNLAHAAGIIRDLAWQKGFPERLFNASRDRLRSESELGHDEALLGHLALAGRPGFGLVEMGAVAANATGHMYVLNSFEPWLERFDPEGTLVYGVDLWLTEGDDDLAQHPSDVGALPNGEALVAEPRAGRVLRFGQEGKFLGSLGRTELPEPVAVTAAPDAPIAVLCAGDASVRRIDPSSGKSLSKAALGVSAAALRGGSITMDSNGTVYVLADREILVLPSGAKKDPERIALPAAAAAPSPEKRAEAAARRAAKPAATGKPKAGGKAAKSKPRRARSPGRRGIAFDGSDSTLLVTAQGRSSIARVSLAGKLLERIGGEGVFKLPRDVCVDERGAIVVADYGNARVLWRRPGRADWETLVGGAGWVST